MSKLKKNRLLDMSISEISLVDRPANEGARAEFAKRADKQANAGEPPMRNSIKQSVQKFAAQDVEDMIDDDAEGEGFEEGDEGDEGDDITLEEIADALDEAAAIIEAEAEAAPDDESVEKIHKALVGGAYLLALAADMDEDLEQASEEIAKRDIRIDELSTQIRKSGAEPIAKAADDIDLGALPEPIRKKLEEGEVALSEVVKIRAEQELDAVRKRVERAGIAQTEAVSSLLIRVAKGASSQADADFILDMLGAAGNVAKAETLLKTFGERAGGEADQFDVRLAAAVQPIMKAARESGSPISEAVAVAKAYEADPKLYEEYLARKEALRR